MRLSGIILEIFFVGVARGGCLPPPWLLVTFHGGDSSDDVNQVMAFTRDGCLVNKTVLGASGPTTRSLRGMSLLPNGNLVVANSYKDDSKLLMYGPCEDGDASRPFVGVLAVPGENRTEQNNDLPLLSHPYGVAATSDGSAVLVTNQNSCSVSRYGAVASPPEDWEEEIVALSPCDYGSDSDSGGMSDLRGLALSGSGNQDLGGGFEEEEVMYVAHEEAGLLALLPSTGRLLGAAPACRGCVGVAVDPVDGAVFAGSVIDNAVLKFSPWPRLTVDPYFGSATRGMRARRSFSGSSAGGSGARGVAGGGTGARGLGGFALPGASLSHPAGLAVLGGSLFVASQDTGRILEYDTATGAQLGTAVDVKGDFGITDDIEAILLSPC